MTTNRMDRYKAVFHQPPNAVPARDYFDGPLLGNGDLGVVIGGLPEKQQFWISKCDFWRAMPRYPLFTPVNVGCLEVSIPALHGAEYYAEQGLATAEVIQTFTTPGSTVRIKSWTPATENALIIEFSCIGAPVDVEIGLQTLETEHAAAEIGSEDDCFWLTRRFSGDALDWDNEAAVAAKILGGRGKSFTLTEGKPITAAAQIRTSHQCAEPLQEARRGLLTIDLPQLRLAHQNWWDGFWSESEINIGDDFLELFYYGSFYIMACCSRNSDFAPAISGNWTPTDFPHWGADYHMNYNHQAPWWGCYGANHISITEPYDTPVLQYLERGKYMAATYLGKRGIFYCVGIGPLGSCSCWEKDHDKWNDDSYDKHFFGGQKSNGSWGGVNMVMRWRATLDTDYARKVYPYLLELASFWEDYLVWDGARYIIVADSIHESNISDVNNVLALGLLRSNLEGTMEISAALGLDSDRHAHWQHILDHLSDYPVYERDGVQVFRYSEVGQDWEEGHCMVGLQHIYPADTLDLDSDPKLLEIAKNTITAHYWGWDDNNHTMSFMPAAARVGYDPETILRNLREKALSPEHAQPNLYLKYGGGGIEACSTVTATLQEMLLQSCRGTVRVFADWPKARDAEFTDLRAYGAFLISAKLSGGIVQSVTVVSEQGSPLTLVNPWPGQTVRLTRGIAETVLHGERFTLPTQPGETLDFAAPPFTAGKAAI